MVVCRGPYRSDSAAHDMGGHSCCSLPLRRCNIDKCLGPLTKLVLLVCDRPETCSEPSRTTRMVHCGGTKSAVLSPSRALSHTYRALRAASTIISC